MIRLILTLVVSLKWKVRQFDVSNTFLRSHLNEEVYMQQPQGFIDSTRPEHVCRLHRSFYGLKQAPQIWYCHLTFALLSLSFWGSHTDSSLFS